MTFTPHPELHTRAAFEDALRAARATVAELVSSCPGDPTYRALEHQLAAIAAWTADGAALTEAQRARVSLGLVAQRELKGDEPALAALLIALHNHLLRGAATAPGAGHGSRSRS